MNWILGAPEIRITIFKPTNNFTALGEFYALSYEPRKRADINNNWDHFYGAYPMYMWFTADYGNIVIYKMIEEDGGQIAKITVKGSILGVELSGELNIKNDDDIGPTVPVDFRDTRCEKIYGDPTFKFKLK
jgi:hypothetical protein